MESFLEVFRIPHGIILTKPNHPSYEDIHFFPGYFG